MADKRLDTLRQRLSRLVDVALGAALAFAVIVGVSALLPGDVHWAIWLAVAGFVLLVAGLAFFISRRVSKLERSSLNTGVRLVGEIKRREAVEAALREEELFPHLNPGPVIRFDGTGRVTKWNYAAGELIGEDRLADAGLTDLIDGLGAGDIETCIRRGVILPREVQWQGRWYVCHLRGLPESGLGIVYALDITAFKEAELKVRAVEERTRAILESAQDGICIVIFGGIIQAINPSMERLFGWEFDEIVGRNIASLLPELFEGKSEDRLDVLISLIERKGTGPLEAVYTGVRKDGTSFPVSLTVSRYEIEGYPRVSCIFRDVTDRVRAAETQKQQARRLMQQNEALEQLVTELNEFNYVASHDLQEPLRTMSTYCGLLKADVEAGKQDRALEDAQVILDASLRMQRLITDLLEYSRSGHAEFRRAEVSLQRVAERVCKDLKARIDETGGRVEFEDLPEVPGDELQIGRVLQNLVANGLKFRRADVAPVVRLSGVRNNGTVRLSVEDNGIGIDARHLDQVFKPFKRLHGVGRYEGSGIGLAVCRKIIERHGGRIEVESDPGKGSCFIVELPTDAVTSGPENVIKAGEQNGGNHDA